MLKMEKKNEYMILFADNFTHKQSCWKAKSDFASWKIVRNEKITYEMKFSKNFNKVISYKIKIFASICIVYW